MPRSESPDAKQLINRNMKLHNVSYQRSLSQTMSAFSCIPFILLTIDMSSSSRIEKLPSSYSSKSAEWKKKKNQSIKKKMKTFIFFIWSISQNSVHSAYTTCLFQEGKFVKIVLRVSVFLTSRVRVSFRPGFVSVIYLLWMSHDKNWLLYNYFLKPYNTKAFEHRVELK